MDPDSSRVRVTVSDGRGGSVAAGGLARWLASVAPRGVRGEVAIALVGDIRMRRLNKTYRRLDRPTDVLSFPVSISQGAWGPTFLSAPGPHPRRSSLAHSRSRELKALTRSRSAASRLVPRQAQDDPERRRRVARAAGASRVISSTRFLGDVVIATGVAARQARQAGHSYATELRILAVHGFLHLIGYDHDDPKDGGRMARAERRLLQAGGISAGLIPAPAGRARRRH